MNIKRLKMNDYFFLGFLLLISYSFINLIIPFVIDIFLAIVLFIIFRKPFTYILKKTKSRKKASVITVLLVVFVVSVPLFFVGMMVSFEATEIYRNVREQLPKIQEMLTAESLKEYAVKVPFIGEDLSREIGTMDLEKMKKISGNILTSASSFLMQMLQTAFFNLTSFLMHLFITPFMLFFMFLDSKKLLSKVRSVLPMERADERKAVDELVKITDTIIIYTFLIGIAEGTYGGILFMIMGISSPFFWALIMVILSMLPIVGANSVIVPAAVMLIINGSVAKGVILLVIGAGAIIINQNIIKPKLTGDRSGLHPVIMFVSTVGGIAWLGVIGFLVGPLIAALTIVSWELFAAKYKTKNVPAEQNDI